ncbi:1517_t:CDS:2, partial [Scutellospora calospora]
NHRPAVMSKSEQTTFIFVKFSDKPKELNFDKNAFENASSLNAVTSNILWEFTQKTPLNNINIKTFITFIVTKSLVHLVISPENALSWFAKALEQVFVKKIVDKYCEDANNEINEFKIKKIRKRFRATEPIFDYLPPLSCKIVLLVKSLGQPDFYPSCPRSTEASTINKVCASGMKAVILAAQNLALGDRSIMIAGGMESMSNIPFYSPRNAVYGHQILADGIIKDGLWDVYNQIQEVQDMHAIESYRRADEAWKSGVFKTEVVPVKIKDRKKEIVVDEDEEYKN